jgi:hypothetical protein
LLLGVLIPQPTEQINKGHQSIMLRGEANDGVSSSAEPTVIIYVVMKQTSA